MNIDGISKINNVQNVHATESGSISDLSSPNKIDISEQAQVMDKLSEIPSVRQEKIDAIKAEMEKGTYFTASKLEKAMENLLQDLV